LIFKARSKVLHLLMLNSNCILKASNFILLVSFYVIYPVECHLLDCSSDEQEIITASELPVTHCLTAPACLHRGCWNLSARF